jgi:hypothetical protein
MQPLTLDDLLPLEEYAVRRSEFLDSLHRYLDRYRKVRLGPRVTLLFENRQTLWFRIQEVLRITRLSEPERVQQELDLYNRLLPGRGHLQGALVIDIAEDARFAEELAFWQTLQGDSLALCVADRRMPSHLVTCRPEDRAIGAAHWVQFAFDAAGRSALADFAHPAFFEISHASYRHESPALGEDVRQSLLEDLELSDKD